MNDENLGLESSPEEEIILPKVSAKERFLSTVPDIEETDTKISATAKDRLFLASDDACLFFNHRVVQSPMLTPTEENYDFLQGLTDNNTTPPETTSPKEENENFNQEYTNPQENESISEKFDKLNLYDDSLQNIQNITSEFLENERKSAENSFDKSEESFCEVDGDIPMVRVIEVTPEASEKDSFEENEKSMNILDEYQNSDNEVKIKETEEVPDEEEEEEIKVEITEMVDVTDVEEHIENFEVMNTENHEIIEEEPKKVTEVEEIEPKSDNKNEPIIEKLSSPKKSMSNSFDMGSELKTDVNGIFDIVRKNKELFEEKAHQKEDSFVPKSYNLIKRLDVSPSKNNEDDDEVFETNINNSFVSVVFINNLIFSRNKKIFFVKIFL